MRSWKHLCNTCPKSRRHQSYFCKRYENVCFCFHKMCKLALHGWPYFMVLALTTYRFWLPRAHCLALNSTFTHFWAGRRDRCKCENTKWRRGGVENDLTICWWLSRGHFSPGNISFSGGGKLMISFLETWHFFPENYSSTPVQPAIHQVICTATTHRLPFENRA